MKSALVTGILGQDGTYLARWLLRQGYRVHGMIRGRLSAERARIRARFPANERRQIRFHTGVMEDADGLARILKAANPEEVYHFAGVSDSRRSFEIPRETFESITLGSLRLLEAGRQSRKAIRFFLASSCEVFGMPADRPQTESTLRAPVTPYGVSKDAMDRLAGLYRNAYGQFVATGILYNHESPLRPANYLSARVTQAVAAIKKGTLRELKLGTLDAERDWSDARDFVRGFHLTLQAHEPADYIFACGQTHTVAEFVDCAFRAAGLDYREFVSVDASHVGPVPVPAGLCGDAGRAKRVLGWRREWRFADTIEDMVQAELEQRPFEQRSDPTPRRQSITTPGTDSRRLPRQPRFKRRR